MSHLPTLGPRGEGWVAIQVVLLGAIALAAVLGPAWEDGLWAATAVLDAVLLVLDAVLLVAGLTLAIRGTLDLRHALTTLPFELKSWRLIPWIG